MIWQDIDYSRLKKVRPWDIFRSEGRFAQISAVFFIALLLLHNWIVNNVDIYQMGVIQGVFFLLSFLLLWIGLFGGVMGIARGYKLIKEIRVNDFFHNNLSHVVRLSVDGWENEGVIFVSNNVKIRDVAEMRALGVCYGNARVVGRTIGFVRMELKHDLPNIILDSRFTGLFSTEGVAAMRSDDKVSVQGSFDDIYTLYCAKGDEQDALYIFTPDVMELIAELGGYYDVEIVNRRLYLYSSDDIDLLDADEMRRIYWIAEALQDKLRRRVARYHSGREQEKIVSNVSNNVALTALPLSDYRLMRTIIVLLRGSIFVVSGIIIYLFIDYTGIFQK